MGISAALSCELSALSTALDSDIDLEINLYSLITEVRVAVASILAITLTVTADDHEVSLTVGELGADHVDAQRSDRTDGGVAVDKIATSLRIPLQSNHNAKTGDHLILYAATPGTFVDLAADLAYTLGLNSAALPLDRHLGEPPLRTGMTGLAAHSAINQAIGVLIERGFLIPAAHAELRRLADRANGDIVAAADRLLRRAFVEPRPVGDGACLMEAARLAGR